MMKPQYKLEIDVHRDRLRLHPRRRTIWTHPLARHVGTQLSLFLITFACAAQQARVDESLIHEFYYSWGSHNTVVREIGFGANGDVYAVGEFDTVNSQLTGSVVRFRADGTLDPHYPQGAGYSGKVRVSALQEDGKLIVGADPGITFNDNTVPQLSRLTADGAIDDEFAVGEGPYNIDFNTYIFDILISDTDEIYVAGAFNLWDLQEEVSPVVRLHGDGTLDPTFKPEITRTGIGLEANAGVHTTVRYPDGRLLIGGNFDHVNGQPYNCVARLKANGSTDETFHPGAGPGFDLLPGFSPLVRKAILQPNGRIILMGAITTFDGSPVNGIVRLNDNGSVDHTFSLKMINTGEGPYAFNGSLLMDMTVDSQGRVVVIGFFNEVNGIPRQGVVRLLLDGSVDPDFDPGNAFIHQSQTEISMPLHVHTDSDDRPVLGGNFIRPDGSLTGLIRFNAVLPIYPAIVNFSFRQPFGGWLQVDNPGKEALLLQSTTDSLVWTTVATNSLRELSVSFDVPAESEANQQFYRVMTQP